MNLQKCESCGVSMSCSTGQSGEADHYEAELGVGGGAGGAGEVRLPRLVTSLSASWRPAQAANKTRARDPLSALCDAHFVSIVRGHEELYDPQHPSYEDRSWKDSIWREIGTIMNQSAKDCKIRWRRLRENYSRAHARRNERASLTGRPYRKPKNERLLSFLKPFLVKVGSEPMLEDDDSGGVDNSLAEETTSSGGSDSASDYDAQSPAPEHGEPQQLEPHLTVDFFVKLGETVKDLPEAVRIRVKREAFKIVTDAEEMLYHDKLKADLEQYVNKQQAHSIGSDSLLVERAPSLQEGSCPILPRTADSGSRAD